jgi:Flp pilus assembly protein TadG
MRTVKRLLKSDDGAAVIELALSLPVLVTMIYGIFEFSQLYEANAGMQHALGEGARYATLCIPNVNSSTGCDAPSDTNIVAVENAKLFGPAGGTYNVQTPSSAGAYKTLTITYTRNMNFLLFTGPAITLTRSKQVYIAAAALPPPSTP